MQNALLKPWILNSFELFNMRILRTDILKKNKFYRKVAFIVYQLVAHLFYSLSTIDWILNRPTIQKNRKQVNDWSAKIEIDIQDEDITTSRLGGFDLPAMNTVIKYY